MGDTVKDSGERFRFAQTLLQISKKDLEASKTLYDKGFYPHAIFYLQQASEKAVKSHGLLLGIMEVEELGREVGHRTWLAIQRYINDTYRILSNIEMLASTYSSIIKPEEIDMYRKAYRNMMKGFRKYYDQYRRYEMPGKKVKEEELEKALEGAMELKEKAEGIETRKQGVVPEDLLKLLKEYLNEKVVDFIVELIRKQGKAEILDSGKLRGFLAIFLDILSYRLELLYVAVSEYIVSSILSGHVSDSRYPRKGHNPLEHYSKNNPLVKHYNELYEVLNSLISLHENLFRDLESKLQEIKRQENMLDRNLASIPKLLFHPLLE